MIELLDAPDHVMAVRFQGVLSANDFDQVAGAIDAKLARHGRIGIVADITGFAGVTLTALVKDIHYNISKLGHWRQFPREAVITESARMAAFLKTLDPLFPQIEVRIFEPTDLQDAISWAGGFGEASS